MINGLSRYADRLESDVFILSGAEDLVPPLAGDEIDDPPPRTAGHSSYNVWRYRPRIEGLHARIERWTGLSDPTDMIWRTISRDNVTTWYGKTADSRILDPADPARIFGWRISESHDDKSNVVVYLSLSQTSSG